MILLEAIEVHDKLNPKIWNEDTTMKPEVENKLLDMLYEIEKPKNKVCGKIIIPKEIKRLSKNSVFWDFKKKKK